MDNKSLTAGSYRAKGRLYSRCTNRLPVTTESQEDMHKYARPVGLPSGSRLAKHGVESWHSHRQHTISSFCIVRSIFTHQTCLLCHPVALLVSISNHNDPKHLDCIRRYMGWWSRMKPNAKDLQNDKNVVNGVQWWYEWPDHWRFTYRLYTYY